MICGRIGQTPFSLFVRAQFSLHALLTHFRARRILKKKRIYVFFRGHAFAKCVIFPWFAVFRTLLFRCSSVSQPVIEMIEPWSLFVYFSLAGNWFKVGGCGEREKEMASKRDLGSTAMTSRSETMINWMSFKAQIIYYFCKNEFNLKRAQIKRNEFSFFLFNLSYACHNFN